MQSIYEELVELDPHKEKEAIVKRNPNLEGSARAAFLMISAVKKITSGRYFITPSVWETARRMNTLSNSDLEELGDSALPLDEPSIYEWIDDDRRIAALVVEDRRYDSFFVYIAIKDKRLGIAYVDCTGRIERNGNVSVFSMYPQIPTELDIVNATLDLTKELQHLFVLRHACASHDDECIVTVSAESQRAANRRRKREGKPAIPQENRMYIDISRITNQPAANTNRLQTGDLVARDLTLYVRKTRQINGYWRYKREKGELVLDNNGAAIKEKYVKSYPGTRYLKKEFTLAGGQATQRIMTNRHPERTLFVPGSSVIVPGNV